MGIKRLLNGLVRRLWLIIALSLAGTIIAGMFSVMFSVPRYEAYTTLLAINRDKAVLAGEALNIQDFMVSQQLIKNYGEIVTSYKVTSEALKDLKGYNLTIETLRGMISIDFKKDSNIIALKASAPEPQMAAAIANAVSRAFVGKVRELTNSESMSILDEAKPPKWPESSGNVSKAIMGLIAGMVAAFGIIYTKELFDSTVWSADDIEKDMKLRIIGIIPEHDIH